ncbi:MAG: DUF4384 domain-containing protein, partial [Acidimicrobiales bacterium]|nr:DUF4384 domain-containing protein [Acidimicrobiales bacterium]
DPDIRYNGAGFRVVLDSLPLQVEVHRLLKDGDDRYSSTLLTAGSEVESGSAIEVRFSVDARQYVYIGMMQTQGTAAVLYPSGSDEKGGHLVISRKNPFEPGTQHTLPGFKDSGKPVGFRFDEVTGCESIVVLASSKPLKNIDDIIASQSTAGGDSASDEYAGKTRSAFEDHTRGYAGLGSANQLREQRGVDDGVAWYVLELRHIDGNGQ